MKPTTRIATISSVVATGRRMKSRDGFIGSACVRRKSFLIGARPIAAGTVGATVSIASLPLDAGLTRRARTALSPSMGLRRIRARQKHRSAVPQSVTALGDDDVASFETDRDCNPFAINNAQRNGADRDGTVG